MKQFFSKEKLYFFPLSLLGLSQRVEQMLQAEPARTACDFSLDFTVLWSVSQTKFSELLQPQTQGQR